jgi:AbiTii
MATQSRSQHVLELARELLDDIELGRTTAEGLILKASRLARWVGGDETKYWLQLEMSGYNNTDPISRKYMGITGRWTDRENKRGWYGPLAQQDAAIMAEKAKLASIRIPDSSAQFFNLVIDRLVRDMTASTNLITTLSGIKSRVLAQLHMFVSEVYYEKEFDNLSESIFEQYKGDVDTLISEHCGDVLEKIPAVMDRLAEGDRESISHALTTCRRIIDSFADSIYSPTEETIELGGNTLKLDASRHQNRINAYISTQTNSQSVKNRLRQNLGNLYDRISSGVHNDVSADEARSLFLNTYLFLGEILHLRPLAA